MVPLSNMRKFHNEIKRKYINKYIRKPSNVLDLASGKGGDLNKWVTNKFVRSVTGFDLDQDSVIEANKRLSKIKTKKKITFNLKNLATEIVDCGYNSKEIISSFFAFHYFFKSNSTLNTILKSIEKCSKKGSILILTLFDGDRVVDLETKEYIIKKNGNGIGNYNNELYVYIKGSVLDIPRIEYIVKPSFLIKKLAKIKFSLIERASFAELYDNKFKLTKTEKDLSFMNSVFIFKRFV